ncbi:MAG: TetR/AcrR family transcriptional regulator C-terminal domain-containing protein [Actinocatenispora sp.]
MPRPRRLERTTVVSAAIDLLDERGLDDLSMYAIAARLGVRQPALYHHFRDKAEILAAVADEVLDRWHTERLPHRDEHWRAFLVRNAHSMRHAMLSVRDGARLVAVAGTRAPHLANAVAQVTFLERHGFRGTTAILAFIAVSRYTIGATLEQQSSAGTTILAAGDCAPADTDRLAQLAKEVAALGPDHEFTVGLDALVAGLAPDAPVHG